MTYKKTALYETHLQLGAKMAPFAGFEMPLWYASGVIEHHAVRDKVGIFDVSHMGEFSISGAGALDLIQRMTTNDASRLIDGQAQYSCMTNEQGGIVDDLIVYRIHAERYLLVVNAGNIDKDWAWIARHNTQGVTLKNESDSICLLAVQGPKAMQVVQKITPTDLTAIKYYHFVSAPCADVPDVMVSNTGYTGSGGVELYVHKEGVHTLWEALLEAGRPEGITPAGLAARDTLRLEKGYCLYGNDIDDATSPLEAGLGWITKFTKDFTASAQLKKQKEEGVTKKLMGIEMEERAIPRRGYEIKNEAREKIGNVTSGALSPTLNKGIGLGYISAENAAPGNSVFISIRGKDAKAVVRRPPFI